MMPVGIVHVPVPQRLMPMPMRMRFGHRSIVRVPMMFVVDVNVFVRHGLVEMLMIMTLGEMQPKTEAHQQPGDDQLRRQVAMLSRGDRPA
jgi:hypothetical protein